MFQAFKRYKGSVEVSFFDSNSVVFHFEKSNIETKDASIHLARLMKDNTEPSFGAYMLAVGSGALGNPLNPNIADDKQRKLNVEIARKPFDTISFVDPTTGLSVAYPTRIIDLSVTFLESEAVGSWTEMGVISPVDGNPLVTNPNPNSFPTYDETLDVSPFDVLLNYLTFSVQTKPNNLAARVRWRFSF